MNTGPLIAVHVLLLYFFLAPVVLFGIFVFFDRLGRPGAGTGGHRPANPQGIGRPAKPEDPAVWTAQDIRRFRDQA
jgi:hypothetical protein